MPPHIPGPSRPHLRRGLVGLRKRRGPGRRLPNLTAVRPVPKARLQAGVVVWAHIPFADMDEDKTRPAVVKSLSDRSVVLLPVSSALSRYRFPARYTELTDPDVAGLHRPTGVQRRDVTVDLIELLQIVGALSQRDMSAAFSTRPGNPSTWGKSPGRWNGGDLA